jgi:hypothetical protein
MSLAVSCVIGACLCLRYEYLVDFVYRPVESVLCWTSEGEMLFKRKEICSQIMMFVYMIM